MIRPPPARLLGRVRGAAQGPTLICVAGIHGNEPAGVVGLERVLERLAEAPGGLRGELVGLLGNRAALAQRRRFLSRDLNRLWTPERVRAIRSRPAGEPAAPVGIAGKPGSPEDSEASEEPEEPENSEDIELRELNQALREILAEAPPGQVYLLDLHTTSAASPPFAVLDDSPRNRAFALALPVPLVLGMEEELPGTLLYHLSGEGLVTLAFEGGQHDDPAAADRAAAAVWIALEACGALPPGSRPEVAAGRSLLAAGTGSAPHVVEVRYRHAITPEDRFRMAPGFASFQPVRAGEPLAADRRGVVAAREDGLLLMPLYQAQGSDGFFLARPVHPAWLRLSAALRRLRLDRALPWLPGVRRHPEIAGALLVDRRIARWLVREVFHFLGYRREGADGPRLLFRRRSHG